MRVVRDGVIARRAVSRSALRGARGGEQGLLGMALAPDYAESRRFFVNFTNRNGDTVVARFRASPRTRSEPTATRASISCGPDGRRIIDQPFYESQRRSSRVRPGRLSLHRPGRRRQRRRSDEPRPESAVAARQDAAPRRQRAGRRPARLSRARGQPVRRWRSDRGAGRDLGVRPAQPVALRVRRLDARRHRRAAHRRRRPERARGNQLRARRRRRPQLRLATARRRGSRTTRALRRRSGRSTEPDPRLRPHAWASRSPAA